MKNQPRVCIVGLGLIGGSLALSLRRSGAVSHLTGVSRPETLAAAESLGALDDGFGYEDLEKAAAECDLVVLATPIKRILSLLETLGRFDLPEGLIVSDVGSTKGLIVEAARRSLPEGVLFIGGHPMAGSEKSGIGAADPFLFQNAIYVLCPGKNVSREAAEELGGLLEKTGARVMVMEAAVHDRTVAAVSHLPQFVAVALVDFAARRDAAGCHALKLAAGGFRDMTRIASSPFAVWGDIVETNTDSIREALKEFADSLSAIADDLDPARLEKLFERAAVARSGIPRDTKGFLRPLAELLVVVEDRPGIIARIAVPLAEEGINIRDIEVLKVREGEGGTMRLAFESRKVSERAKRILEGRGFSVRHREL